VEAHFRVEREEEWLANRGHLARVRDIHDQNRAALAAVFREVNGLRLYVVENLFDCNPGGAVADGTRLNGSLGMTACKSIFMNWGAFVLIFGAAANFGAFRHFSNG